MATKPASETSSEEGVRFKVGDRVRIRHADYKRVEVAELRGPLGPGGAQVYRVRVRRKPRPVYIEVLGEQLELVEGTEG